VRGKCSIGTAPEDVFSDWLLGASDAHEGVAFLLQHYSGTLSAAVAAAAGVAESRRVIALEDKHMCSGYIYDMNKSDLSAAGSGMMEVSIDMSSCATSTSSTGRFRPRGF
jgi:hypothetical protein